MLGFRTVDAALKAYRAHYDRPGFYGGHATMTIGKFKRLLESRRGKIMKSDYTQLRAAMALGFVIMPEGWAPVSKGAGHKYVKRVPYIDSKGKRRYRYTYHVGHGHGVHHEAHFVAGAAFSHGGGHYHITAVHSDGTVTIKHDETGKTLRMSKRDLSAKIRDHHAGKLDAYVGRLKQLHADSVHGSYAQKRWAARLEKFGHNVGNLSEKERGQLRATIAAYEKAVGRLKADGNDENAVKMQTRVDEMKRQLSGAEVERGAQAASASTKHGPRIEGDEANGKLRGLLLALSRGTGLPVRWDGDRGRATVVRGNHVAHITNRNGQWMAETAVVEGGVERHTGFLTDHRGDRRSAAFSGMAPSVVGHFRKLSGAEVDQRKKAAEASARKRRKAPGPEPAPPPAEPDEHSYAGGLADVEAHAGDKMSLQDALHQLGSNNPHRVAPDTFAAARGATAADLEKIRAAMSAGKLEQASGLDIGDRAKNALKDHRSATIKAVKEGTARPGHINRANKHHYSASLNRVAAEGRLARKKVKTPPKRKASAPKHAPVQGALHENPIDHVNAHIRESREGKVSAEEHRKRAHALLDNEEKVKTALAKKYKKAQLDRLTGSMWSNKSETKARLVDMVYRRLTGSYDIAPGGETYSMADLRKPHAERMRERYDKITDEHIAAHAERVSARSAEREAQRAEHERQMSDPKTLEDFRKFDRYKGRDEMTPEQHREHDRLEAEKSRGARAEAKAKKEAERATAQRVEGAGGMSIEAGVHTKRGHKIWTVRREGGRVDPETYKKMRAAAKALGGRWNRKGPWGEAGFVFSNEENARKFSGISEQGATAAAKPAPEKMPHEKLLELAHKTHSDANAELHADRQTNTARRAAMAAGIAAHQMGVMRLANTARNVAEAIRDGKAKHLSEVRHMTHVDQLDGILTRAVHDRVLHEAREKHGDSRYGNELNNYYEEHRHRDATHHDIEHAEYPYPRESNMHVERMLAQVKGKRGSKKSGIAYVRRALEQAKKSGSNVAEFKDEATIQGFKDLRELAERHGGAVGWAGPESIKDYNRMRAMGIHTEHEMREALREYSKLRGSKIERSKEAKHRDREMELARAKIPGYFPTPKHVVQDMVKRADIQPGDKVYEPSAGAGHIADHARAEGAEVHVGEINHSLREHLKDKGHNIVGRDSLDHHEKYDKVVMNPPFERGQDIDHVRHAFEHNLKPGGKVVAIMSEGPFFRQDSKATAFREFLEKHGGTSRKMDPGTFKQSDRKTGVSTRMVVIEKPGAVEKGAKVGKPPFLSDPFGDGTASGRVRSAPPVEMAPPGKGWSQIPGCYQGGMVRGKEFWWPSVGHAYRSGVQLANMHGIKNLVKYDNGARRNVGDSIMTDTEQGDAAALIIAGARRFMSQKMRQKSRADKQFAAAVHAVQSISD